MFGRPVIEAAPERPRWPLEFDPAAYVRHGSNRDLKWMKPAQAAEHYRRHGRREGRVCSAVASREDLLALIDPNANILEIGPFFTPLVDRATRQVAYVDALTTEQLRERAATIPGGAPERV